MAHGPAVDISALSMRIGNKTASSLDRSSAYPLVASSSTQSRLPFHFEVRARAFCHSAWGEPAGSQPWRHFEVVGGALSLLGPDPDSIERLTGLQRRV